MTRPALKKRFGQHHLIDGSLCHPLLSFLRPVGERVVEIGPGGGVLTREILAAKARRVVAVELDPAWAQSLRRELPGGRLDVVVGDSLDLSWRRFPAPTLAAGNLPYAIATQLISRLLPCHARIPRAAFLVQKEVAERLVARPRDSAYGSLSVLVAAYSKAVLLSVVRRGSFRPPPKVEGAFVGFELQPPPLPEAEMDSFLTTVRLAFGHRRKTLKNSLAGGWGRDEAGRALERAGIDPGLRPQDLSLEEFLAIHAVRPGAGSA